MTDKRTGSFRNTTGTQIHADFHFHSFRESMNDDNSTLLTYSRRVSDSPRPEIQSGVSGKNATREQYTHCPSYSVIYILYKVVPKSGFHTHTQTLYLVPYHCSGEIGYAFGRTRTLSRLEYIMLEIIRCSNIRVWRNIRDHVKSFENIST